MTQVEQDLLARYIEGRDAEAFREIVTLHQNMVYATCRRILRNPADAEDAAQNCFLALARKPRQVQETLRGWLHRVAVRTSLNMAVQERARKAREAKAIMDSSPSESASWEEISGAVDKCIDQLPDDLRVPVVRYYLEGQKQEDIAAELGLTQAGVSKRLQRGTESLREALRKGGWMGTLALLTGLLGSRTAEAAPPALVAALGKIAIVAPASVGVAAASATGATTGAGSATTLTGSVIGGLSVMSKVWIAVAAVAVLAVAGVVVVNQGSGGKEAKTPSTPTAVSNQPVENKAAPLPPAVVVRAPSTPAPAERAGAPAWGEAVDGVQCRLRAESRMWQAGQVPVLRADLRNEGERQFLAVIAGQRNCQLEVDGRWFEWPLGMHGGTVPSLSVGQTMSDTLVTVSPIWQQATQEAMEWRQEKMRTEPREGEPPHLTLTAGRHSVRVAFLLDSLRVDTGDGFRAVSNAVEIEIAPAAGASPSAWPASEELARAVVALHKAWNVSVNPVDRETNGGKAAQLLAEVMDKATAVERLSEKTPLLAPARRCKEALLSLQEAVKDNQPIREMQNAVSRAVLQLVIVLSGDESAFGALATDVPAPEKTK